MFLGGMNRLWGANKAQSEQDYGSEFRFIHGGQPAFENRGKIRVADEIEKRAIQ